MSMQKSTYGSFNARCWPSLLKEKELLIRLLFHSGLILLKIRPSSLFCCGVKGAALLMFKPLEANLISIGGFRFAYGLIGNESGIVNPNLVLLGSNRHCCLK